MSSYFDQSLQLAQPWLDGSGPAADMVISTRARLVRNLPTYNFTHRALPSDRALLSAELLAVLKKHPAFSEAWHLKLGQLNSNERALLFEKQLTRGKDSSPDLHQHLLVASHGAAVALINDEDHLQLQVYETGFQPSVALAHLQKLEPELETQIDFSFMDIFGYLTASSLNTGTGLRLSVQIHLPGLVMGGEIPKILNALRQLRFDVRGMAGEGSAVRGAVFEISNLVTLGRDETEIASNFEFHIGKVLRHERTARQQLFSSDSLGLEDLARRSLAVLQSARLMTSQEAADRLNHLRLGVSLGMLPGVGFPLLNEANMRMQTAHLQNTAGHILTVAEITEARAIFLRELFSNIS